MLDIGIQISAFRIRYEWYRVNNEGMTEKIL